jgi:hypothetical protein
MNQITEKLVNVSTYGVTLAGIAVNFENVKSLVLFIGGFILLVLQIRKEILLIKNKRKK